MEDSLFQRICNWPFENKWKAAAIGGLLTQPVFETAFQFIYLVTNEPLFGPTSAEGLYWKVYFPWGTLYSIYVLDILDKRKPPRIWNSLKSFSFAVKEIAATARSDPEGTRRESLKIISTLTNPKQHVLHTEAEYAIQTGDFGRAMALYANCYDGALAQQRRTLSEHAIAPLTHLAHSLRGHPMDLIYLAFMDLEGKKYHRLFARTIPRLLRRHPDALEFRVFQAEFLRLAGREQEATVAWKSIASDPRIQYQTLDTPKRRVTEINLKHFRQVAIFKRGGNCRKEYDILRAIHRLVPYDRRFTPTPLACFTDDGEEVLIVRRVNTPNLETYLSQEGIARDQKQGEVEKALRSLRRLHTLRLDQNPLREYDPISDLFGRIRKRFSPSEKTVKLRQTYYRTLVKKMAFPQRLSHGDLYPANVLQGGTIIDLERLAYAHPWHDLEMLLGSPALQEIDDRSALDAYNGGSEDDGMPEVTFSDREPYAIHAAICSTASFIETERGQYYYHKAIDILEATGQSDLKSRVEALFEDKLRRPVSEVPR